MGIDGVPVGCSGLPLKLLRLPVLVRRLCSWCFVGAVVDSCFVCAAARAKSDGVEGIEV
jgi:hypothetical protein